VLAGTYVTVDIPGVKADRQPNEKLRTSLIPMQASGCSRLTLSPRLGAAASGHRGSNRIRLVPAVCLLHCLVLYTASLLCLIARGTFFKLHWKESLEMLNMGVIGCGWAGEHHAEAILSPSLAGRARVVSICDNSQDRVNARGEAWGVESRYTDYRRVLAQSEVDAVSICTPHDLHATMAIAAAEAGKHILVEKPLACTLDEADAMIAAADRARVVLMVAENVRFNPYYLKAKELIDRGYLGDIFLVRISRLEAARQDLLLNRPWFLEAKRAGGGIMMAGGIHDLEAMRMLVGEVKSVFAYQAKKAFPEMQGDDTSVAIVEFEDGTAGVLIESFSVSVLESSNSLEIHGSLGSIETDIYRTNLISLCSEELQDFSSRAGIEIIVPETNTFAAEMLHFVDCVEHGGVPVTSGEEERKPLAAVLAAYESMATGRRVPVRSIQQRS